MISEKLGCLCPLLNSEMLELISVIFGNLRVYRRWRSVLLLLLKVMVLTGKMGHLSGLTGPVQADQSLRSPQKLLR